MASKPVPGAAVRSRVLAGSGSGTILVVCVNGGSSGVAASRDRRRGTRVLLGALLVVAVAGAVWWGAAAHRLSQVAVTWDNASGRGGPFTCRGTTVTERPLGAGLGRVPVFSARPGMDCALSVRVTNRGSGTVHLRAVVLPFMGPAGGGEVQVASLADLPRAPAESDEGTHAAFEVDRALNGGASEVFAIHFTHRDDGCSAATTWFQGFPKVSVSALGLADTVTSPKVLAFRGTGQASGCGDHG